MFLVFCIAVVHPYWFDCGKCPKILANFGSEVRIALDTAERIMNDVCETDEKTETECLNSFQAVKKVILAINIVVFPPKVSNTNRTFACSHLIPVCPHKDSEGHSLPTTQWSCGSCFTLFNISISALKDPIEELNRSAADVLCREAGEECKSEFMKIVDVVGAVGKMFRGKVAIEKICEDVIQCKYSAYNEPCLGSCFRVSLLM